MSAELDPSGQEQGLLAQGHPPIGHAHSAFILAFANVAEVGRRASVQSYARARSCLVGCQKRQSLVGCQMMSGSCCISRRCISHSERSGVVDNSGSMADWTWKRHWLADYQRQQDIAMNQVSCVRQGERRVHQSHKSSTWDRWS